MKNQLNKLPTLKTIALTTALAVTGVGFSNIASADDDQGFYIAAAYNDVEASFAGGDQIRLTDDDKTESFRAGYMFNNTFGIDLGYIDLGDYSQRNVGLIDRSDLSADAYTVAGVLNFTPTDLVDIYARLGISNLTIDTSIFVLGGRQDRDEDEVEPFAALGVALDFGMIDVFAEYSRYDTDIRDLDIDMATLGVRFEFGSN